MTEIFHCFENLIVFHIIQSRSSDQNVPLSFHCFENVTVLHLIQKIRKFLGGKNYLPGKLSYRQKIPTGLTIPTGSATLTEEVQLLREVVGRTDLSCENSSHFINRAFRCDATAGISCISETTSCIRFKPMLSKKTITDTQFRSRLAFSLS